MTPEQKAEALCRAFSASMAGSMSYADWDDLKARVATSLRDERVGALSDAAFIAQDHIFAEDGRPIEVSRAAAAIGKAIIELARKACHQPPRQTVEV